MPCTGRNTKDANVRLRKLKKEDRFLRGRQIAYMINEYFRVTGTHQFILDFTDLLRAALRLDDV